MSMCPCGADLGSEADKAHGVCRYCRVDAKKQRRKAPSKPDFEDIPIPGIEEAWGLST